MELQHLPIIEEITLEAGATPDTYWIFSSEEDQAEYVRLTD